MRKVNYDLHPVIEVKGTDERVMSGWKEILSAIEKRDERIVICDLYPGVSSDEVMENFSTLGFDLVIDTDDLLKDCEVLDREFRDNITDDRVFGFITHRNIGSCFDKDRFDYAKSRIEEERGRILIVGPGASTLSKEGLYIYFDISRWEVQLRYRKGMSNWLTRNPEDPILSKFKHGYFVEWRIADRHKMSRFEDIDLFIDTHVPGEPKMVSGEAVREGLRTAARRPFRMEPYFDEGVWGGQWMREKFGLPEGPSNYAWSFDGVPEENCLNLGFSGGSIKVPAIDLVLYRPRDFLGDKVYGRYGAEFPIRFDLLDTMGGQNLSLQVHPLTEYIQQQFGMNYTQDESYYILDASEGSKVYLGVKEGIDNKAMMNDLRRAEKGEMIFDADKYVNSWPAAKHDHFLIPGGTIHCSGKDTMVLEISATSYIFTFKLWDWGRLGLDGIPRPVHIGHGERNIQWYRDTEWVKENLIHQDETVRDDEHVKIEKTGLHISEPILTHRYSVNDSVDIEMNDGVHMLNLVEGERALVESTDGSFEPFEVHYAETFIVPAFCRKYRLTAPDGVPVKVIAAEIR